jgi:hypothetical protein
MSATGRIRSFVTVRDFLVLVTCYAGIKGHFGRQRLALSTKDRDGNDQLFKILVAVKDPVPHGDCIPIHVLDNRIQARDISVHIWA